jgi:hypothetical protein
MANINRNCPVCNKIYSNKFLFWRNIFRCKQCGELIINRSWNKNRGIYLIGIISLAVGNLIGLFSNELNLLSYKKYILFPIFIFSFGCIFYQGRKVYREPQLERMQISEVANYSAMTKKDLIIILSASIIIIGIITVIAYLLK